MFEFHTDGNTNLKTKQCTVFIRNDKCILGKENIIALQKSNLWPSDHEFGCSDTELKETSGSEAIQLGYHS